MNTIPSIFNQRKIPRTILGGSEESQKILMPQVTCIVLTRNSRNYRSLVFENLITKGFAKIICVENKSAEKSTTEQLAHQFPTVKFLISQENVTQGDLLNLAVAESTTEYILVVQEELCLDKVNFTPSLASKLIEKKQFCIAPKLFNKNYQKLPVEFIPTVQKSTFRIKPEIFAGDNRQTFYAGDLAGFYNREKYILLGGIDYTITSEYWQKVDLFFRSWLWGEKTTFEMGFDLAYGTEIPEENQTVDFSYLTFFLKNLLPVFKSDHAKISDYSYITFKARSSCGFVEAMKQFKDAQRWVEENKYRFKKDAVSLIENWYDKKQ